MLQYAIVKTVLKSSFKTKEQIKMNNKAFNYKRIAVGYKDRPFLHKQVMEQLQRDMSNANFQ